MILFGIVIIHLVFELSICTASLRSHRLIERDSSGLFLVPLTFWYTTHLHFFATSFTSLEICTCHDKLQHVQSLPPVLVVFAVVHFVCIFILYNSFHLHLLRTELEDLQDQHVSSLTSALWL